MSSDDWFHHENLHGDDYSDYEPKLSHHAHTGVQQSGYAAMEDMYHNHKD